MSLNDSKIADEEVLSSENPSQSKYLIISRLKNSAHNLTSVDDRNGWRNRSMFQDMTQTWLNNFVEFAHTVD